MKRALALGIALLAVGAAPAAVTPYHVTIALQFGEPPQHSGYIILTDPISRTTQPIPPRNIEFVVTPTAPALPNLAVTATGGVHVVLGSPSFGFGMPPQLPDAKVERAGVVGPFSVSVTAGPPVNERVTVAGYAYERLMLGCVTGNSGGLRYDAAGTPIDVSRPEDADVYITGPRNVALAVWDRCPNAFHDANATGYTLHVPGGAVEVSDQREFQTVTARDWKGAAATIFDVAKVHGPLLFRTRSGRLVKTRAVSGEFDVQGATLAADAHDTFADVAASRGPAVTRVAVTATGPAPPLYTAAFTWSDPVLTPYGKLEEIEVAPPHPQPNCTTGSRFPWASGLSAEPECSPGPQFPDRPTELGVAFDPAPFPTPSVVWSIEDTGKLGDAPVKLVGSPFDIRGVSFVGVHPGRTTIAATIGSPVYRQLTIPAVSYDALEIFTTHAPRALRFVGDRAVPADDVKSRAEPADDAKSADLFMSPDGTLHFPGGGALLTNGSAPELEEPTLAHVAPPFTKLTADAWRNERTSIDAAGWRAVNTPCYHRRADGSDAYDSNAYDSTCKKMSASVILFKIGYGNYVKLHVIDFSDGIRATFEVLHPGDRTWVVQEHAPDFPLRAPFHEGPNVLAERKRGKHVFADACSEVAVIARFYSWFF